MDLVGQILMALEVDTAPHDSALLPIAGYRPDQIVEHVRLLGEAGFVKGVRLYSIEYRYRWVELGLTVRGRNYLAAARSESPWSDMAVRQSETASPERHVRTHALGSELVMQGVAV